MSANDNYEPDEFVKAKGIFGLAIMIESSYSALTYYINAKDLFHKSIEQNEEYLPSYYYLALTEFRIGLIREQQGEHKEAMKFFEFALINLEKVKSDDEFKEEIAEILPKLLEAYSSALSQIGEVLYQQENFDASKYYTRQQFLFTRVM